MDFFGFLIFWELFILPFRVIGFIGYIIFRILFFWAPRDSDQDSDQDQD